MMGRNGADLGVDRAHWRWATTAVALVGLVVGLWLVTKLISGWDCRFWKDSHEICPSNSDMAIGITLTLAVLAGSLLVLRWPPRRSPRPPSPGRVLLPVPAWLGAWALCLVAAGLIGGAILTGRPNGYFPCKIDVRTLRTAQATYAAGKGRGVYAPSQRELVSAGLLSEPSPVHDIRLRDPDGEGPLDATQGYDVVMKTTKCGGIPGEVVHLAVP